MEGWPLPTRRKRDKPKSLAPAAWPKLFAVGGLCAAALAAACAASSATFVAPSFRIEQRRPVRTALRISHTGHSMAGGDVIILRQKAKGFKPTNEPESKELSPVVPGFSKQKKLFIDFVKEGHPASEIFVRFEGKTPWKKVGDVVSTTGNFEQAVRAMWPMLVEHSYYLSRKVRFWLPTEHSIQFGYSNEKAEIETVTAGPLREGTRPLELKAMLNGCGFLPAEKPRHWRHMHTNAKEHFDSKKGWATKHSKQHLLDRKWHEDLEHYKRFNKDKFRYKIKWKSIKKGLFYGVKEEKNSHHKPTG